MWMWKDNASRLPRVRPRYFDFVLVWIGKLSIKICDRIFLLEVKVMWEDLLSLYYICPWLNQVSILLKRDWSYKKALLWFLVNRNESSLQSATQVWGDVSRSEMYILNSNGGGDLYLIEKMNNINTNTTVNVQ